MHDKEILEALHKIPEGFSTGQFRRCTYKIIKTVFVQGRSLKIEAFELGGNDYISCNVYFTNHIHLKPCEMTIQKVLDFISGVAVQSHS